MTFFFVARAPYLGVRWRCADVGQRRLRISVFGEIAERHEPDGLIVLDDGKTPDRLLTHEIDGRVDRRVRRHRRELLAADLVQRRRGQVLAGGSGSDDNIAVGNDAADRLPVKTITSPMSLSRIATAASATDESAVRTTGPVLMTSFTSLDIFDPFFSSTRRMFR